MTVRRSTAYLDRSTGELRRDVIYSSRFLPWAYGTQLGWWLTRMLFSLRWVSAFYGWLHRLPSSPRAIERFAASLDIDLEEVAPGQASFKSLNDLICRRIDLQRRPVDQRSGVVVAPVDGRVSVHPCLEAHSHLTLKGMSFQLQRLVRDSTLARRYEQGSALVSRLYLNDYHHFHFPVDGVPRELRIIKGRYFATSPYAADRFVPYLNENVRALTVIDTTKFGRVLMLEIGAFTVGSIEQDFRLDSAVTKGEHKGVFGLGGSVVVLLFEPGVVALDPDLCRNSARGLETYVRMGESVGAARGQQWARYEDTTDLPAQ